MLKHSLLIIFLSIHSYALTVLIAKESFAYEEKLSKSKLRLVNVNKVRKSCIPLTLKDINENEYVTKHYINDGSILCQKNVKTYKKQSVTFKFGALEIEKKGKIVYENNDFIRIKKADGTIEKIYKDGRLK